MTSTKKNKTIRVQILVYEIIQQIRYHSQRWTAFGYRVNSQISAIKSRTFLLPHMHENVAKRFLYQQLPVGLTWSKQNYGTENAAFRDDFSQRSKKTWKNADRNDGPKSGSNSNKRKTSTRLNFANVSAIGTI